MDKAFDILAEQYRPMLVAYARALLHGHDHDAEDVAQETLLTAHRQLDQFQTGGNFGRWLRGIVRNKCLESQRAGRRRALVDSRVVEGVEEVYALFDPPPGEEPWADRARRLVRRCVGRLSGHLQDAVTRVYQDGLSLRAAAQALGATPAAVAQRLSRARELLRQCVQEHPEAEA